MEVIYALIPGMLIIGLIMVGVLIWAVKSGQYEDLEGDAQRLLMDDEDPPSRATRRRRTAPRDDGDGKRDARNWPDAGG